MVWRTPPMRPAIRIPLKTRPGWRSHRSSPACGGCGGTVERRRRGSRDFMTPAKPLALGGARDVDGRARLEGVRGEFLARRVVGRVSRCAARRDGGGGHPALAKWPVPAWSPCGVDRAETDWTAAYRRSPRTAIWVTTFWPTSTTVTRNEAVVLVPQLGHAELLAQQALDGLGCSHLEMPQSLISMLTSAGRSRRISGVDGLGRPGR